MIKSFLKKKIRENKGFTLIELLVTIVIFVILTGIVLFNQSGFNNGIILRNLAYDIVLNIKQVQTYGIAVKESQTLTGSAFSSYGIHFNLESLESSKNFILFADNNSNGKFDGDRGCPVGDSECIQRYTISRGSYISKICIGTNPLCSNNTNEMTIFFKRPNPDAIMIYRIGSNDDLVSAYSRIIVSSADNSATTSVVITSAGQIYVGN